MFRKTIVPLGKKKRKKKFNKCHNGKKWPFVACQGIPGPQGPDSPGLSQDSAKALQDPSIPFPPRHFSKDLQHSPALFGGSLRGIPRLSPHCLRTPRDSSQDSSKVPRRLSLEFPPRFPAKGFPRKPKSQQQVVFFLQCLDVTEYRPYLVALASDCVCFSGAVCLLFGYFGELKGGGVEGRGHCFVCVSSLSSGIFMAHLFFARRGPGDSGETPLTGIFCEASSDPETAKHLCFRLLRAPGTRMLFFNSGIFLRPQETSRKAKHVFVFSSLAASGQHLFFECCLFAPLDGQVCVLIVWGGVEGGGAKMS